MPSEVAPRRLLDCLLHAHGIPTNDLNIYPCSFCNGLHVGHTNVRHASHSEREGRAKVAYLLSQTRSHEQVIEKRRGTVVNLRKEMDSIIIFYGCCLDVD